MSRRRSHHKHAIRGGVLEIWEANTQWAGKARALTGPTWCGEPHGYTGMTDYDISSGEDPHAFSRRMADCPKCAAAIGKARLAQIADRVRVEPVEVPTTSWGKKYRSLNKVYIDGAHMAWIVMDNGWGNPWTLRALADEGSDYDFGPMISHKADNTYVKIKPDHTFQPIHFAGRDMMASAALRARESGELLTRAETNAKAEAYKARRAVEEAEREESRRLAGIERDRKDGLRAERKATALAGLNDALDHHQLSNLQRAGLEAARDIINGKDVI